MATIKAHHSGGPITTLPHQLADMITCLMVASISAFLIQPLTAIKRVTAICYESYIPLHLLQV